MTSKKSFWASCKENHKRRIWVWIVAVLAQLMAYVGGLTVYLSRIGRRNSQGSYKTYEMYKEAMYQAAQDALGFQDKLMVILLLLAVTIGMQGFSYLYDRKKVDLYHSVPVDRNRRFAVVYVNGFMIYLTSALVSLLIGTVAAAIQGAVNGSVLAMIGFGFIWQMLFFLVMYHTAILAVMLTGNQFIGLGVAGMLVLYELFLYYLINTMMGVFFRTVSGFYVGRGPKLSVLEDYIDNARYIKYTAYRGNLKEVARLVLPYYGKWFILAVVILAAAWICYRRRPSEAAGKAMAFPMIGQILKVVTAIPIGLGIGMWVHNAAYGNTLLTVASMVGCGVIVSAAVEVIFDFDIKSLFRHPATSGAVVAGIVVVFLIFKLDLFGYDAYLPQADKLDSIALNVDYYGQFWDNEFNYVQANKYAEEHMFITDMEPVLALADKSRGEMPEDMKDPRVFNILYRLKSGRKVDRRFWVDIANPANAEKLDRIVGSQEFKNGTYQILTDQDSYDQVVSLSYSNGAAKVVLPTADVQKLREAYIEDMEQFDFSLAGTQYACGQIVFQFPNWMEERMDVYESFEHTIAYLKSQDAYYPLQLNPEDIESITITNYHNDLKEQMNGGEVWAAGYYSIRETAAADYSHEELSVSQTFYEQEEFAGIVPVIYPSYMGYSTWHDANEIDQNYDIYITFRKDTTYPYDRGSYGVYYKFYTGHVPEFVEEATAFKAQGE
ncbi:MAG: hypothetical protein HDR06_14000 [Lachnospiraceae bacterium]|nr:hypothetical protein [Lachnospiraceae bacterium]